MTIEDIFYRFFTKDVYVAQTLDFVDDEIQVANVLFKKNNLTQNETDLVCCFLSGVIYKYEQGEEWLKLNIIDYELHKKQNGLVYGIFYANNKIYIVFKGSSTINDFIKDANIKLVRTKYFPGQVHAGFCDFLLGDKNYREIFSNLKKFMKKHDCNEVYLTRHSLGGALSSLFYSLCKRYKYFDNISFENITFGSPRVGDRKFCKNLITKRIVNKQDIVAMLPFPIFYRHLNTFFGINYKWGWPSIVDHDINKYYQNLKHFLNTD